MAHTEQINFCKSLLARFPHFFKDVFVLDIGSLDINGNNQHLFENSLYLGVDIAVGRNVDIASMGHEIKFPDSCFDVVISTECFEHDQFYNQTITNIYRMLKPGGFLIFTCATTGRPEHGTRRTTPNDAPLLEQFGDWSDYYKNLTEVDIRSVIDIENNFSQFEFSVNEKSYDLYFWGIKSGSHDRRNNYSFMQPDSPLFKGKKAAEENVTLKENISRLLSEIQLHKNLEEDLKRQIHAIKMSTSWKFTAPLRYIKNNFFLR